MFTEHSGFKSKVLVILSVKNVCCEPGSNSNFHSTIFMTFFLSEIKSAFFSEFLKYYFTQVLDQ